jgi:hypothetical protein
VEDEEEKGGVSFPKKILAGILQLHGCKIALGMADSDRAVAVSRLGGS